MPTSEKELEDKQLAQVPKHRFQSTLRYIPSDYRGIFAGDCVTSAEQFEDDLNSLELSPYATVDLAVSKGAIVTTLRSVRRIWKICSIPR